MNLYIRIVDGKIFEHPITEENMLIAFPDVDLNTNLQGWTFRDQIDANLFEDRLRFYPFIPIQYIKIDIVFIIML